MGDGRARRCTAGLAEPNDALVLHTSGTTSRPKIVALRHEHLAASAGNVVETLRLAPAERCLNVMPLHHIHGLVAATLASMSAGASACCSPGFDAARFFAWLVECKPTWYTASELDFGELHHTTDMRTPLMLSVFPVPRPHLKITFDDAYFSREQAEGLLAATAAVLGAATRRGARDLATLKRAAATAIAPRG